MYSRWVTDSNAKPGASLTLKAPITTTAADDIYLFNYYFSEKSVHTSHTAHIPAKITTYVSAISYTLQPLYNMVRYSTGFDMTWFKDGSPKCIDYIEK